VQVPDEREILHNVRCYILSHAMHVVDVVENLETGRADPAGQREAETRPVGCIIRVIDPVEHLENQRDAQAFRIVRELLRGRQAALKAHVVGLPLAIAAEEDHLRDVVCFRLLHAGAYLRKERGMVGGDVQAVLHAGGGEVHDGHARGLRGVPSARVD
jgi:hypothetical protein